MGRAGARRRRWGKRYWPWPVVVAATVIWLSPLAALAGADVPTPVPSPNDAVPTPRLSPSSQPGDPIGSISTDDDSREAAAHEDSDLPEADPATAMPGVPTPMPSPGSSDPLASAGLELAIQLLANGDPAAATVAAYALPNRVDIKIVDWLVATSGAKQVASARIAEVKKELPDWPGQGLLRLRFEQALVREQPPADEVIRDLAGSKPISDAAALLLAHAFMDVGRKADAANLVRDMWRTEDLSASTESEILADFSDVLTAADHKARMDRLLYEGHASDAFAAAEHLDKNQQALAKAVAAVIKRQSMGPKALERLPTAVRHDPLAIYSRIRTLRRADKIKEAAALLKAAPRDPEALVDPDAWWVERRLVSRALIDDGNPKLAYQIAANHSAESPTLRAEAEFHAGWYALEFLHEPAVAEKHFAAIAAISSRPLSLSRAEYWLGRAAADAGDSQAARDHFQRAATYQTTFYGQLAATRLGDRRLILSQPPPADAATRERFASREMVQVIQHLTAVGDTDQIDLFYRRLADTLTDPAEIGLLAAMAEKNGEHQIALRIGVVAESRGLPVDSLAFPIAGIPTSVNTHGVERPVVFAVARQESNFNPEAVSSAGARGLLQLMPATAQTAAKLAGVSYSKTRLTSDPGYNASLGAAHLSNLVDDFRGSYVMTFAAYNAGASRVTDWVKRYGDPRDPKVDVVDWIERIPFTETRNYVERIMENLQVYRARLQSPALTIEADLKRGTP